MRTALAFLGYVVAFLVLVIGGAGMVFLGFLEWGAVSGKRSVEFAHPGDECDSERLELNIEDGTPLFCTTGISVGPRRHRGLEGFSAAQNDEVFSLAERLGDDGLDEADQQRIEDRVDEIAATLPPIEDEQAFPGPNGIHRILLGVAMIAMMGLFHLAHSARERRYARYY